MPGTPRGRGRSQGQVVQGVQLGPRVLGIPWDPGCTGVLGGPEDPSVLDLPVVPLGPEDQLLQGVQGRHEFLGSRPCPEVLAETDMMAGGGELTRGAGAGGA